MRIDNLRQRDDLKSLARTRRLDHEETSVSTGSVELLESEGWAIVKRGKYKTRMRRPKTHHQWLEDRVWTLFYNLGFVTLSGEGGAFLLPDNGSSSQAKDQLDVVAADEDSAIVVECKSSVEPKSKVDLQETLALLAQHKSGLSQGIKQADNKIKKKVGGILVLWNMSPSETDLQRAESANLLILDGTALEYYEMLCDHTGRAAKYQLLSELFADQTIDGLKTVVPAVEAKIGKFNAYTFAISPDHLLKIAYVAHRSRGEFGASGAYQRMVKKSRLKAIRDYIDRDGIFPTNVVINFTTIKGGGAGNIQFHQSSQQDGAAENIRLGWLHLPARYQAAWIIDGQHRLLAYSGHERADKCFLAVTAFVGLDPEVQADLFVSINSKQTKVSGNLLAELHAGLHFRSQDPRQQAYSIASRAIQDLGVRQDSPLYGRILGADGKPTPKRCITLQSLAAEVNRPGLLITRTSGGQVAEWGPLWTFKAESTLRRTKAVLDAWFSAIRDGAPGMWNAGKEKGGFSAMNNGVAVALIVLRSVFEHIKEDDTKWDTKSDTELIAAIEPFGKAIGGFFAKQTPTSIEEIRRRNGVTGQTRTYRQIQAALRDEIPSFDPSGLTKWIEEQADEKATEAYQIVKSIESRLQVAVIGMLQNHFGNERKLWWPNIPQKIRVDAATRRETTNREHGDDEEKYFNLIDYREIMLQHWASVFQSVFAFGDQGNKEMRTNWLQKINAIRNKVMHGSTGGLSVTEFSFLKEIDQWLAANGV